MPHGYGFHGMIFHRPAPAAGISRIKNHRPGIEIVFFA
jgi:hypothetical protein